MLPKTFLPAAIAAGLMLALPAAPSAWAPAIGSAAAAKNFFTRKRINGRWVEGKFPKEAKSGRRRGAARHRLAARGRHGDRAPTARLATTETPATVLPPAAPRDAAPAAPLPRPAPAPLTTASLDTGIAEGGREAMRMALEAKARALAGTASATAPMAPAAAPASANGATQPVPARTVTFDLEKGSRTIVYGNDVVVSEPFDVARVKDLVGGAQPATR